MKLSTAASISIRLVSIAAAAMLAACNSEPAPEAQATPPKPAPMSAAKTSAAATDPAAKMARGVGSGKPGAAVDIRYEILARPEVGKPVEVDIALLPGSGVESMEVTFSGMEGITLAGSLVANFPSVKAGETYKHTLSLLPDRNGVFYITVSVNALMGQTSIGK